MAENTTSGVLYIHSCPPALVPHMEWAMGRPLGRSVNLSWIPQPVLPGAMRAEFVWEGPIGTAAIVASSLRGWEQLRFEITENQTASTDGGRWLHTPSLGIFHMQLDSAGNAVIPEDRIRYALELSDGSGTELARELNLALGQAWDDELEPFRHAGDEGEIIWLHRSATAG